jgi:hypothetical protein
MTELPRPDALLEIARATLQADILPHLTGEARFKALMVANAMAIAQRAAVQGDVPELANADAICEAIRAGMHDGDAALAARLRALAEARCRISAPKALG